MEQYRRRTLAVGFASTGLATALITMGLVWRRLDSQANLSFLPIWPLPALYLIEVVTLAGIVLLAVAVAHHRGAWFVAWLALGALSAMALLGAMSIGLNIALPLIFLIPASILGGGQLRVTDKILGFVAGVLLQVGMMVGIIQYLLRRPMSG